MERRLLTVREVAKILDCSPRHVKRMAKGGRMPAPTRLGRLLRWDSSKLDAWIADGCPEAGSARP